MSPIFRIAVLHVCFSTASLVNGQAVRHEQEWYTRTIPQIELREASFAESLDAIRKSWQEAFPDDSFPVAVTSFEKDPKLSPAAKVTLSLKNVPYYVALTYVAELAGYRMSEPLAGIQRLTNDWSGAECSTTRVMPSTKKALQSLGLTETADAADTEKALQALGVKFDGGFAVIDWTTNSLVSQNSKLELQKIAGILTLLEAGHQIVPPTK